MSVTKSALLVDDDPELLIGASLRLRAAGYQTATANSAEQGLDLAAKLHPDVIVMDVRMPRKDGIAALHELKQDAATKDIPVVMLSASVSHQHAALEAGARFFIAKPYDGKKLIAALQAAIEQANSI